MTKVEHSAILTLLQLIEKLQPSHISQALDQMDLGDEAWDEELQTVKDLMKWADEPLG